MKIKIYIPDYPPIINNSVELEFGEDEPFLLLHGPNGCGKSTLLHLILGLKNSINIPKVVVNDEKVYPTIDFKEMIRYLPQNAEDGLFSRLSVEDNLILLKQLLHIKDTLNNNYVDDDKLCLGLLSVGEKNLLLDAILKSLPDVTDFGNDPLILLLDEPFAGLDVTKKNEVFVKITDKAEKYLNSPLKFLIIDHLNIIPEEIVFTAYKTLRKGIVLEAIQCKNISKMSTENAKA